jgi:hypothetical protein
MTRIKTESELHSSHPCYPRNLWFIRVHLRLISLMLVGMAAAGCGDHPVSPPPIAPPATQTAVTLGQVFGDVLGYTSIAFVCDASGSMMEKMEALKAALSKAIEGMGPNQNFSITFFQNEDSTYIDLNPIPATPENKRKAEAFLAGVSTNGSTDPIPALAIAFAQHPQVVFLSTDGDFPDNDAVLREIHKLDPDRKVKINTFAFLASSDNDPAFVNILGKIAKESGGSLRVVHVDEIQK